MGLWLPLAFALFLGYCEVRADEKQTNLGHLGPLDLSLKAAGDKPNDGAKLGQLGPLYMSVKTAARLKRTRFYCDDGDCEKCKLGKRGGRGSCPKDIPIDELYKTKRACNKNCEEEKGETKYYCTRGDCVECTLGVEDGDCPVGIRLYNKEKKCIRKCSREQGKTRYFCDGGECEECTYGGEDHDCPATNLYRKEHNCIRQCKPEEKNKYFCKEGDCYKCHGRCPIGYPGFKNRRKCQKNCEDNVGGGDDFGYYCDNGECELCKKCVNSFEAATRCPKETYSSKWKCMIECEDDKRRFHAVVVKMKK